MISIPYTRTNGVHKFMDTIILSEDDYAAITPEEITAMQDDRFAAWVAHVEQASNAPPEELTEGMPEELPVEVANGE